MDYIHKTIQLMISFSKVTSGKRQLFSTIFRVYWNYFVNSSVTLSENWFNCAHYKHKFSHVLDNFFTPRRRLLQTQLCQWKEKVVLNEGLPTQYGIYIYRFCFLFHLTLCWSRLTIRTIVVGCDKPKRPWIVFET